MSTKERFLAILRSNTGEDGILTTTYDRLVELMVEAVEVERRGGVLTFEQIEVACRNIGYDLTCGACAEIFYTGATTNEHECERGCPGCAYMRAAGPGGGLFCSTHAPKPAEKPPLAGHRARGRENDEEDDVGVASVELLVGLSKHDLAVVRLAAVCGMCDHLGRREVVERLREMVDDPSSEVAELVSASLARRG